jgi:hypothetical protein
MAPIAMAMKQFAISLLIAKSRFCGGEEVWEAVENGRKAQANQHIPHPVSRDHACFCARIILQTSGLLTTACFGHLQNFVATCTLPGTKRCANPGRRKEWECTTN